jgi:hypothetical protein
LHAIKEKRQQKKNEENGGGRSGTNERTERRESELGVLEVGHRRCKLGVAYPLQI